MKLTGYIEAFKEFMFTIPIYTDGDDNYFHMVNAQYIITGFNKVEFSDNIKKINEEIYFEEKDRGAIVFVGAKDDLITGKFEDRIKDVRSYLNHNTSQDEFLSIKDDLSYFESLLSNSIAKFRRNRYGHQQRNIRDIQYILNFLNEETFLQVSSPNKLSNLIDFIYNKVSQSENFEKTIVEIRDSFNNTKPIVHKGAVSLEINDASQYKRHKPIKILRKREVSIRQTPKKNSLQFKIKFIRNIIENIETPNKSNSKIIK